MNTLIKSCSEPKDEVKPEWEVIPSMSVEVGRSLMGCIASPGVDLGERPLIGIDTEAAKRILEKLQPGDAVPGTVHFSVEAVVPVPKNSPARMFGYFAVGGVCAKNKDGSSTVRIGIMFPYNREYMLSLDELKVYEAHELQHAADNTSPSVNRMDRRYWRKLNANPRYFIANVIYNVMQTAYERIVAPRFGLPGIPLDSRYMPFAEANSEYVRKALHESPKEVKAYNTFDGFETNPPVIWFGTIDSEV